MPRKNPTPALPAKPATIDEVAAAAGVSTATVSRVVNGESVVREATRAKVMAAVEALRYKPKLAARTMAGGRSSWIALVYRTTPIGSLQLMQSGAIATVRRAALHLSVHECVAEAAADLEQELIDIADTLRPRGIILPPPLSDDAGVLAALRRHCVPFVRIGPSFGDPAPRVWFDDRSAMREITSHVITQGHRELALIYGLPDTMPDPRREGYLDAVRAHRLGASCEKRMFWGAFSFEQTLPIARRLLARKQRPTAIITATDDMAAACLHAAQELGLRVPQDLTVTGFDDAHIASVVWPTLTTIHAPISEMGAAAADLLCRDSLDMDAGVTLLLPYRLVQRGSDGPVPTGPAAPV